MTLTVTQTTPVYWPGNNAVSVTHEELTVGGGTEQGYHMPSNQHLYGTAMHTPRPCSPSDRTWLNGRLTREPVGAGSRDLSNGQTPNYLLGPRGWA